MKSIENFSSIDDTRQFALWSSLDNPVDFKIGHPYIVDGLLISLIEKGESRLTINFKEYQTKKNTVLVIYAHSIIEMLEVDPDRKVKAFFVPPEMLVDQEVFSDYEIFFHLSRYPYFSVDEKRMQELIRFHDFVSDQQNSVTESCLREFEKYLINALSVKIKSIYHEIDLLTPNPTKTHNEVMVDRFYKLLFEYYKEEREVSFYADKLCVSPKHLSFVIKQVLGQPIYYWITYLLLSNIKSQLKTTRLSIKEIADEFNFASPSVFGRFFKQHTGMTPVQYREN